MATVEWTDARVDDAFEGLRTEMREMRSDMRAMHSELRSDIRQLWVTMVAGYAALVAAVVATQL